MDATTHHLMFAPEYELTVVRRNRDSQEIIPERRVHFDRTTLTGKGLSSSTVNVVWGFFNAVVGYLLLAHVGAFNPRATSHILVLGLGLLVISLQHGRLFGQFHGGNAS